VRAWLRLLRISLAPTAAADAVAGLVFACGGFPADARAWFLVPASLGVYHGALALNDWNDRDHDGRTRPGRPLPSGAISPRAALRAATLLLALGIGCAAVAAPVSAAWMGGVALLAVAYDLFGRGPRIGPTLLALCRAGNLASGIVWAAGAGVLAVGTPWVAWPVIAYGAYVGAVSRLGRLEDGEDSRPIGSRPRGLLRAAAFFLLLLAALPAEVPLAARIAAFALACAGGFALWREARARTAWSRADVERAMGLALRRLLIATAVVSLLAVRPAAGNWAGAQDWTGAVAAAAILAGYPIAHALRRAFPPS
jgi:4-hydroxybenzoate polyprenyltransferase